jgi:hypothetical protein
MAFPAKDGKKFSNKDSQRTHDRMSSAKSAVAAPEGEPDGDEGGAEQVVAQHGPAHTVHIAHDHEMGVHEVHSEHHDGHHHVSQHGSVEEAHEHGKKLATPQEQMGGEPEEGSMEEKY